ncbi:MAG: GDP-mannose 4,6-dehydratase [Actinobacteria bacterium]|nr:GDP-mannose 4,6-dehydratase [Actinomycetota bacterium]
MTGASGFVGRHLIEHLKAEGDEVAGFGPEVDIIDADAVKRAVDSAGPDAIYHLAAATHVGESWDAPSQALRVNAEGTLNVLRAAGAAGVGRVLAVGSAEEYGIVDPASIPIDEDTPLRPVSPYAASKVAAEFLALQAFLGQGVGALRVRAFNHIGPGQSERFVVAALAARVAEAVRSGGRQIRVGSLEPVRDFTDVRDVVRAYRLVVERGAPGEVYNVCSGRGVSVKEIVDHLIDAAGGGLDAVVDPDLVRPVDLPVLVGDNSRIRSATGWEPAIPLEATLADVLAEHLPSPKGHEPGLDGG